jgi:REP element-mobilizing transposase RayT
MLFFIMAQSLSQVYLHVVFSTKKRVPVLEKKCRPGLFAYIAGTIKLLGAQALIINGVEDHLHILTVFPRTITIAEFIKEIKRTSSKWLKTQGPQFHGFSWQTGYGVFSVSYESFENVKRYIERQEEHHRIKGFKEEFLDLLEQYDVDYDPRYLWD